MDELEQRLVEHWAIYMRSRHKDGLEAYSWSYGALKEVCAEMPAIGLRLIQEILKRDRDFDLIPVLAAGPLEDLLVQHGPEVIDEIEQLARQDAEFAKLLGGVWRNAMAQTVWDRVVAARDNSWDRTSWQDQTAN